MRDFVDLFDRQTRFRQTISDSRGGEISGVLFAREPFFSSGRNTHSVDNQRSGGIVPLRDPVFAFVESRPMGLLEGNRTIETANTQ